MSTRSCSDMLIRLGKRLTFGDYPDLCTDILHGWINIEAVWGANLLLGRPINALNRLGQVNEMLSS